MGEILRSTCTRLHRTPGLAVGSIRSWRQPERFRISGWGPEPDAKPGFELCQVDNVGPHLAIQDVADRCVIHTRESLGFSKAAPTKCRSEIQSELSGGFGCDVVADSIRPIGAVAIWRLSPRTGHIATVDSQVTRVVVHAACSVTAKCESVGIHHQSWEFTLATLGGDFRPDIPDPYWAEIGDFVRSAVSDAEGKTPYTSGELLGAAARHVLWCWQTAGLELDRALVFRRSKIGEYISQGCVGLAPASRGNRRSQLLRMSEALLPFEAYLGRLSSLGPSEPLRPYSKAEIVALRYWANDQNTPARRRDAMTLLALGLGAGLAAEDIAGLEAGMVTEDGLGVQISVPGRRARVVPVRAEWEAEALKVARALPPHSFIFGSHRTTRNKNFVNGFVAKSDFGKLRPSIQRLRATWIVGHVAGGTPLVALMTAAGVQSLEAFSRYLRFMPGLDPEEARRALRGQPSE